MSIPFVNKYPFDADYWGCFSKYPRVDSTILTIHDPYPSHRNHILPPCWPSLPQYLPSLFQSQTIFTPFAKIDHTLTIVYAHPWKRTNVNLTTKYMLVGKATSIIPILPYVIYHFTIHMRINSLINIQYRSLDFPRQITYQYIPYTISNTVVKTSNPQKLLLPTSHFSPSSPPCPWPPSLPQPQRPPSFVAWHLSWRSSALKPPARATMRDYIYPLVI